MPPGKRFNFNDDEIRKFTMILHEFLTNREGPMRILDLYPWMAPYVPEVIKNSWMKVDYSHKIINELFGYLQVKLILLNFFMTFFA